MRSSGSSAVAVWAALQLLAAVVPGTSVRAEDEVPPPVDETDRDEAKAAYSAGLAAYARGAYADASREFTRAMASSASPNAKLMLGRCLRQLRQLPEAYRVLGSIARPSETPDPRYAKTRSAAEDELRVIRPQIGILTVYVRARDTSALLHVNGQPIPPIEWNSAIPVRAGVIKLSLETAPGVIERRDVELGAGQRTSVIIGSPEEMGDALATGEYSDKRNGAKGRRRPGSRAEAIEAPAPDIAPGVERTRGPSGLRVSSYIAAGTAAASFIAFGVLGTLSAANYAKLEDGCPNQRACSPELESIASRGHTQQILANVSLVVGATALSAAAAMFIMSEPASKKERRTARRPATPRTALAITPLGVALRGEL